MLIIIRDIFYALEGFANCNIRKQAFTFSMCGLRMVEIKASI